MDDLLSKIIRDGPAILDVFVDSYYDLNGSEPDVQYKANQNIWMSLISSRIEDENLAQCILGLGDRNVHMLQLLMTQLVSDFNVLDQRNSTNGYNIRTLKSLSALGIPPVIIGLFVYVISIIFTTKSIVLIEESKRRKLFIERYGYSIPSKSAIQIIINFCQWDSVLGICSGLGVWEYLLRSAGLNIVATDIGYTGGYYQDFSSSYISVEMIGHIDAIKKYRLTHNVLFMSWPPLENSIGVEAVRSFMGDKIIYIGECYGGSTANRDFFLELNSSFTLSSTIRIPSWNGIYDKMYFFTRI